MSSLNKQVEGTINFKVVFRSGDEKVGMGWGLQLYL